MPSLPIARTATYATIDGFRDVTALLMNIDEEESKRLRKYVLFTKTADVIHSYAS